MGKGVGVPTETELTLSLSRPFFSDGTGAFRCVLLDERMQGVSRLAVDEGVLCMRRIYTVDSKSRG